MLGVQAKVFHVKRSLVQENETRTFCIVVMAENLTPNPFPSGKGNKI